MSPPKKALDDLSLPKGKFPDKLTLKAWGGFKFTMGFFALSPSNSLKTVSSFIYLRIQIMSKFRSDFIAPNTPSLSACLSSFLLPRIY